MNKKYSIYILILLLGVALYIWGRVLTTSPAQSDVRVVFLDVGQGDAILVLMPAGKQMLIDGGPDDSVLQSLGKYMPLFDNEIETVVLTHPHADHLTGLNKVLQKYKVDAVYEGQGTSDSATFKQWKEEISSRGIKDTVLSAGQNIGLGDNIDFKILTVGGGSINNSSVVGRLEYKDTAVMMTGDAETEEQTPLCSISSDRLRSNVIKVAHHGSSTGAVKCFMEKVAPEVAVISVGKDNKYGHPHAAALEMISQFTKKILRTDQAGSVVCESSGQKISCD